MQEALDWPRWKSSGRSGYPLLELVVLGTPQGVLHELLPHSMSLVVKHLRSIGNRAGEHGACGRLDLSRKDASHGPRALQQVRENRSINPDEAVICCSAGRIHHRRGFVTVQDLLLVDMTHLPMGLETGGVVMLNT